MPRHVIVVAGIIRRDGKFLIGQRKARDRHGLKWEFPGGKIEPGESPGDALRRELKEELGIDAVIGREVARYEHSSPRRPPLTILFMSVDSFTGEPVERAFEQIRWEEPANFAKYDFLDGDQDVVRRIARGRLPL